MPALVAIRHEAYLQGFYQSLLARRKAALQAVVAVMRKLLHAFFAMFQCNQPYDGLSYVHVGSRDTVAFCA
jgi:transposase